MRCHEHEQPCLAARIQTPTTVRLQFEALEYKVRVRREQCSAVGETLWPQLRRSWRRACCSNGVIDVKLTIAAVVEQAECSIAALLDFRDHEIRTDGVDGAGWYEHSVTSYHGVPRLVFGNRTVVDCLAQLRRRYGLLQTEGNGCAGAGTENVPGFAFPVRQTTDRLRKDIVWMHLNGQWLTCQ